MIDRAKLIDVAIGLNENYRVGKGEVPLEIGFLYGTVEFITALTLKPNESYSDVREEIAQEIDRKAAEKTYPLIQKNIEK